MQDCSYLIGVLGSSASFCTPIQADDGPKVTDWIQSIGTLAALAVAIWVPAWQNYRARSDAKAKESAEVRSFLRAIKAEIGTVWENYERIRPDFATMGRNDYVDAQFRFSDRSFSIYDNAGVQVGKVGDSELQRLIVTTYGLAKSLVVSFELNNQILENLESVLDIPWQTPTHSPPGVKQREDGLRGQLVDYTKKLSTIDDELSSHVRKLTDRLDLYLAKKYD